MSRNKGDWQRLAKPFAGIEERMIKSEAFKVISNPARVALLLLKAKQWHMQNKKEIVLTYREVSDYIDRHTYANAIRQLEEAGFINRVQRGGLYRRTNIFTFVNTWKYYKAYGKTLNRVRKSTLEKSANKCENTHPERLKVVDIGKFKCEK